MSAPRLPEDLHNRLRAGTVIPAMPLALDEARRFSRRHQQALARYYIDAGAGGIAVGVHSTQFEIRDPDVGLFEPVLSFVAAAIDAWAAKRGRPILKIAGVCGPTPQALQEADFARAQGYHAALLSLSALRDASEDALIEHCKALARVLPIIGFYLQPAVGGRALPYSFWKRFADIEGVVAIKIAPFNRYQSLDVVRAVCAAGRHEAIALYTGNDDNIVADLLTEYVLPGPQGLCHARLVGGLLGHWCVWTRKAVELLESVQAVRRAGGGIDPELLTRGVQVTDTNAALFDAANRFAGCIPGIHEVLRRQGLLPGTWCLDPQEVLSPGQKEEIDRVYAAYPHLNDDAFVAAHLTNWLETP